MIFWKHSYESIVKTQKNDFMLRAYFKNNVETILDLGFYLRKKPFPK